MTTRNAVLGLVAAAGLAAPAGEALACGGGAMMGSMMGPGMLAPVVGPVAAAGVALPAIGAVVSVLPQGYVSVVVNGIGFFRAGPTWYQVFQGPKGPMYRVVPVPHGL
jgi:hypothetical protein